MIGSSVISSSGLREIPVLKVRRLKFPETFESLLPPKNFRIRHAVITDGMKIITMLEWASIV
jgi:hypothetical protein